jgi:hypothetical protein
MCGEDFNESRPKIIGARDAGVCALCFWGDFLQ